MKHGLKDKINKIASVIFMTLIAGLLLVAFVPEVTQNLFSYRSDVSNTLAARVNSDPIARSEVTFYIERAYGKLDEAYKTFAESQALRALIQRKLLVQVADQSGFLPTDDARVAEFADFLHKNYHSYLKGDEFDIDQLSQDLAKSGRYGLRTLSDLQNLYTQDYLAQKIKLSLEKSAIASDLEDLEDLRQQKTILSYKVVIFDNSAQQDLLKKREKNLRISDAEIQEKFKEKYLAKDKKATLDKNKREIIRDELLAAKKSKAKADLTNEIRELAKTSSLNQVASKFKLKVYSLENVPLSQSLEKAKPKEVATSLVALENSEIFRKKIFSEAVNTMIGPVESGGNTYFVNITERQFSKVPSAKDFMAMNKSFKDWASENGYEADTISAKVKDENQKIVEQAMLLKLEDDANITKYARPSEVEG